MSSTTSSQRGEGRGEKVEEPPGILGVRLVRALGPGYRDFVQRGRAKGKQVEEPGIEPIILNLSDHVQPVAGSQDLHAESVDSGQDPPNAGFPQVSISPASDTFEIRLHEVGALSASWGD
ncbi:hypothetical protein C0995_016505 [Termitomyces sp. Mi166|nr:hypothetical protein C0995_016505 [Termitomyces sp. Mi166\